MTGETPKALGNLLSQLSTDNSETLTVRLTEAVMQKLSLVYKDLGDLCVTSKKENTFPRFMGPAIEINAGDVYRITRMTGSASELFCGDQRFTLDHDDIDEQFIWYPTELQYNVFMSAAKDAADERHAKLRKLATLFLQKETFKVGDEVVWKADLSYCTRPFEGEVAIVLEVLDKPITSREDDPDGDKAGHINDIVICVLKSDGTLFQQLVDSRRFTKYVPKSN